MGEQVLGRELKTRLQLDDDESGNLESRITFCLTRPNEDDNMCLLDMPPLCYTLFLMFDVCFSGPLHTKRCANGNLVYLKLLSVTDQ